METDNRGAVHYEAKILKNGKHISKAEDNELDALEDYIKHYYKGEIGFTYEIYKVTTESELKRCGTL